MKLIQDYKIFSYLPSGNTCFEQCIDALKLDNQIFGRNSLDETSFDNLITLLARTFDSQPKQVSLAVIGLVEHAVKSQFVAKDSLLVLFEKAIHADPLKAIPERIKVVSALKDHISSILTEQKKQNEFTY